MDVRPRDRRLGSRSLILVALAMTTAASSCAGGTGGTTGTGGSTGTGTGGTNSTGGATGTGGSNTGTGGTNVGTGGVTGSGGTTSTGGSIGSGGVTGSGGASSTGGTTGTGGNSTGTGGGAGAAGAKGTGGASTGGTTGTAGTSGCPSNATFCSDFETAGLPTGAIYMVNASPGDWSRDFAIDTTQHHAGNSSLLVKAGGDANTSGSNYKMLAVPATAGAFWVRFWVESDVAMGYTQGTMVPHNAFAGASVGSGPNDLTIQFAEDVGIAFNTGDSDQWPTGYGRLTGGGTMPYTLPAMTWECIEISFDGTNRVQQLYINNTQLINAANYPTSTEVIKYFAFGFEQFAGPSRHMWYDDVVVAPTRIGGCPTVAKSNN